MTGAYLVVAARTRQELDILREIVARAERAMRATLQGGVDSDLLLDSVALSLHDYYVGLERVFELVASAIDGGAPSGPEWHRDLLRQMALEVPKVRPAVLRRETVYALDEFLRFRHVVRNVYAFELESERLAHLVSDLPGAFEQVRADLEEFALFLEGVGSDPL